MHTYAGDQQNSAISDDLKGYLKLFGETEEKILHYSAKTSLHEDLGYYGEIAEDFMTMLAEEFEINLDSFDFDQYFPPEWPHQKSRLLADLFGIFPWIMRLYAKPPKYLPVTLGMIDEAIRTKKWDF